MMNQKGKISFTTIIMLLIVVYGGFLAFKFIAARADSTSIKAEIVNRIGLLRGPDFTLEDGVRVIREVLVAHKVLTSGERVKIEGEEDTGGTGESSGEGSGESSGTNSQLPPRVAISVKFIENKTKVRFLVTYDVELDLILFKSKQDYSIEDEVTNFN
jgi:hypothetical protein